MPSYFTETRNVELSILFYLQGHFSTDWSDITIVKSWKQVFSKDVALPIVCIYLADTNSFRKEIGNTALEKRHLLNIDIFAKSDGMRLDLAHYTREKLKDGWRHYCYDDQTEILTNEGWKFFKDLNKTEKIATFDPLSNNLEYSEPIEFFSYDYNGKMYEVKNKYIDLLVTPNHKLPIYDYKTKKYLGLFSAENIFNKKVRFNKCCIWKGKKSNTFILPSYKVVFNVAGYINKLLRKIPNHISFKKWGKRNLDMKLWLEFLGYYLSEGCIYNSINISQSFKNFEKKEKIKKCLDKLGFKYYEDDYQLRFYDIQLAQYLKQFGKSKDKFIPQEFLQLDKEYLQILLNALNLGDGSISKKGNSFKYATISKKLADNVQELIIKCGYSSDIFIEYRNFPYNNMYLVKGRGICGQFPAINDIQENKNQKKQDKWINYTGKIYSINVPNHIILVRRNGKVVWSGNSHSHASGDNTTLTRSENGNDFVTEFVGDARIDLGGDGDDKDRFRHRISIRVRHSI